MKKEYEEAFVEVEQIINLMPTELSVKIPIEFRRMIIENKATDYKIQIVEPLEEQKFKEETIVIMGLIYRDFLASPEERERLQLNDNEELKKLEQQMYEKYDIDNTFKKRKAKNKQLTEEEYSTDLMLYEEQGFLKKIFNLIKGIFSKNKY